MPADDSAGVGDEQLTATAAAIIDRLSRREETNKVEWAKRREEAQDSAAPEENVDIFLAHVSEVSESIRVQLAAISKQQERGDVKSQLAETAAQIQTLDSRVAEASYFLPAYELRSATATVTELRALLETSRTAAVPKRKFAFSKKVNRVKADDLAASVQTTKSPASSVPETPGPEGTAEQADAGLLPRGVPSDSTRTITLSVSQLKAQDYVIENLSACTILVCDPLPLPMLRLQHLRNCHVQAGPVTGATFVDDLRHCVVMLATYQVRIHTSKHCDFYLRTRSRPIIEHSTGLCFAPFVPTEPATDQKFQQAQLAESEEQLWKDVDDFGWIKAVKSPNWNVLETQKRQPALSMLIPGVDEKASV